MATRSTSVVRSWPYYHLKFIDTATENGVQWAHDNPEGIITFDVSCDDTNGQVHTAIKQATDMWVNQGLSFDQIFKRFPDAVQNWSATP